MAKRKRFSNLDLVKVISILTAPILIAFVSQLMRPLVFGSPADAPVPIGVLALSAVGFLLGWGYLIIAGAEKDAVRQKETDGKIDQAVRLIERVDTLMNGGNFTKVGLIGSKEVKESIVTHLPDAISVRNTMIGYKRNRSLQDIADLYQRFFDEADEDGQWLDLASHHELFGERFSLTLKDTVGDRHRVKGLRHSLPIVNFTILEKEGGEGIVYFGWAYGATPVRGPVFRSEDPELVGLFTDYFDHLWAQKTVGEPAESGWVDYSRGEPQMRGIDIVDRAGTWVTIGRNQGKTESFAVVNISFDGGTRITGKIYSENFAFKGHIDAQNIDISTSRIHFDYRISEYDRLPRGRCQYRFRNRADGEAAFIGYFVNDSSKLWKDVYGLRLNRPDMLRGDMEAISLRKDELIAFAQANENEEPVMEDPGQTASPVPQP